MRFTRQTAARLDIMWKSARGVKELSEKKGKTRKRPTEEKPKTQKTD